MAHTWLAPCLLAALCGGMAKAQDMRAAPAPALVGCFEDPTSNSCQDFTMSDDDVLADMKDLCVTPGPSMPYMLACSLWAACQAGTANGPYCAPFSLLGTGCVDMPRMSGCRRYRALCGNPATVVQQCKATPPLPKALTTKQARDAISAMCGSHSMEGCATCTGTGYAQCPKPLESLANICWGMSAMEGCTPFFDMCSGLENSFPSICMAPASGS